MGFRAEEVAIPDIQETSEQWDILFSRSLFEMFIHRMGAAKELPEVIEPNVNAHRKSNSRPDTVSTANPRLEPEHISGINPKLRDLFFVGGKGHEMFSNVSLIFRRLEKPVFRCRRIGARLGGCKCFAGNEEESGTRIGVFECFCDMSPIDVGHEKQCEIWPAIWLESFSDHHRTKVAAPNSDIDNGFDRLAAVSGPLARSYRLGEFFHVLEDTFYLWPYIFSINLHRSPGNIPQSWMENGPKILCYLDKDLYLPVFSDVDVLSGK